MDEINLKLQKEYQKTIEKLFDMLTKRDKQLDDLGRAIRKLDKQVKTLSKLNDKLMKESINNDKR